MVCRISDPIVFPAGLKDAILENARATAQ